MLPARHEKTNVNINTYLLRRRFVAATATFSLMNGGPAAADGPQLHVDHNRGVGSSQTKRLEPWIAANPRDSSNLVILASRYLGKVSNSLHTEPAAWFSADGGATWSRGEFTGLAGLQGPRSSSVMLRQPSPRMAQLSLSTQAAQIALSSICGSSAPRMAAVIGTVPRHSLVG